MAERRNFEKRLGDVNRKRRCGFCADEAPFCQAVSDEHRHGYGAGRSDNARQETYGSPRQSEMWQRQLP